MVAVKEENLDLAKGLYAVFETSIGEMVCKLEENEKGSRNCEEFRRPGNR